jgi:hypothetical protein
MEFENVSSQESGRSIVIDFQTMNIHTGLYVRKLREEVNLIIGRGNTTSHDDQGVTRTAVATSTFIGQAGTSLFR